MWFSNNLLAGPSSVASDNPSPLLYMRNNKKRQRCQPSTNPLGWNNFSMSGSASFDDESHLLSKYFSKKGVIKQRQFSAFINSEEDQYFNWERRLTQVSIKAFIDAPSQGIMLLLQ